MIKQLSVSNANDSNLITVTGFKENPGGSHTPFTEILDPSTIAGAIAIEYLNARAEVEKSAKQLTEYMRRAASYRMLVEDCFHVLNRNGGTSFDSVPKAIESLMNEVAALQQLIESNGSEAHDIAHAIALKVAAHVPVTDDGEELITIELPSFKKILVESLQQVLTMKDLSVHPVGNPNASNTPARKWFVYDAAETQVQVFDSQEEAEKVKDSLADAASENASDNGWGEDDSKMFWGEIIQEFEVYNSGEKIMFEGEEVDCYRGRWIDLGYPGKGDHPVKTRSPKATFENKKHPSHQTRYSDSSLYDEVCVNCGATDVAGNGWGALAKPCKKQVVNSTN